MRVEFTAPIEIPIRSDEPIATIFNFNILFLETKVDLCNV